MDRERWQKLRDLFAAARSVPEQAREGLLQEYARADPALVEEARELLAADAQPGVLDAPAPHLQSMADLLKEPLPDRIGAYRVVGELGRGGMGIVYLADRADGEFQHRVAIKLIQASDANDPLHQRFRAERQILARLVHPNIARLLDGGLTEDRRPYLVMEYVDGLAITTYCDDHRLDIPMRLRLFADVCAAVQHAHQNLVVHRDLKPGNILVSTDGHVHLLDFGIAKLIDPTLAAPSPLTRVESRLMTPEYASPEQVRGEPLTTASDIYSLGVVLYELICGYAPYRFTTGSMVEIANAVCQQDPPPPSGRATRIDRGEDARTPEDIASLRGTTAERLTRLLDGDLDGIVSMAMRKEPSRRYASADMLRQDVERYLKGLPVLAHRGSRRYRLGKFLRRYRIQSAAAAMVLTALLAGLSLAVVQERRTSRERDRAERALAESTGVTNFLVELFQTGDPTDATTAQLSALDLLERGAQRADDLSNQPIVYARLLDVIGQMSFHLGRWEEAQRRLEQAIAIRRSASGDTSLDLAGSLIHLAWLYRSRNDYSSARPLVEEALEIRRRALPPDHPDIGDALFELGSISYSLEQERLYRQAIAIFGNRNAMPERRVGLLQALCTNLRRQGRFEEAVAADREALALAERMFGHEHHVTGYAMIHLADQVRDIEQDAATAERLYRRGLGVMTAHFGENSLRLLHGLNSLAGLLASRGEAEGERLLRRALEISQSATGAAHPRVADQLGRLARELARQGRLPQAERMAQEALELTARTLGPRHQAVAATRLTLLAEILELQRRHVEADQTYALALETLPRPSSVITGEVHREYGRMLLRRGDDARAEQQLLQSLASLENAYGARHHPNVQETKRALMELYRRLGRPELVERYRVPPGRFIAY